MGRGGAGKGEPRGGDRRGRDPTPSRPPQSICLDTPMTIYVNYVHKLHGGPLFSAPLCIHAVTCIYKASSSAVAKRLHDASYLSVVSFNSTKR